MLRAADDIEAISAFAGVTRRPLIRHSTICFRRQDSRSKEMVKKYFDQDRNKRGSVKQMTHPPR
jgi:hypothetical protein